MQSIIEKKGFKQKKQTLIQEIIPQKIESKKKLVISIKENREYPVLKNKQKQFFSSKNEAH